MIPVAASVSLVCLIVAALIYFGARKQFRRRRPGLPPPDRATVRDCFKPVARQ
jgi:hypothetical protein